MRAVVPVAVLILAVDTAGVSAEAPTAGGQIVDTAAAPDPVDTTTAP